MKFEWPFVSKRAYMLLEGVYERTIVERDAQTDRADRLADQLVNRFGFEPVSVPVRREMAEAAKEFEAYVAADQFEDVGSGMLSEEVLKMVDEKAN